MIWVKKLWPLVGLLAVAYGQNGTAETQDLGTSSSLDSTLAEAGQASSPDSASVAAPESLQGSDSESAPQAVGYPPTYPTYPTYPENPAPTPKPSTCKVSTVKVPTTITKTATCKPTTVRYTETHYVTVR